MLRTTAAPEAPEEPGEPPRKRGNAPKRNQLPPTSGRATFIHKYYQGMSYQHLPDDFKPKEIKLCVPGITEQDLEPDEEDVEEKTQDGVWTATLLEVIGDEVSRLVYEETSQHVRKIDAEGNSSELTDEERQAMADAARESFCLAGSGKSEWPQACISEKRKLIFKALKQNRLNVIIRVGDDFDDKYEILKKAPKAAEKSKSSTALQVEAVVATKEHVRLCKELQAELAYLELPSSIVSDYAFRILTGVASRDVLPQDIMMFVRKDSQNAIAKRSAVQSRLLMDVEADIARRLPQAVMDVVTKAFVDMRRNAMDAHANLQPMHEEMSEFLPPDVSGILPLDSVDFIGDMIPQPDIDHPPSPLSMFEVDNCIPKILLTP